MRRIVLASCTALPGKWWASGCHDHAFVFVRSSADDHTMMLGFSNVFAVADGVASIIEAPAVLCCAATHVVPCLVP
jgi:hypothetical protein